MRVVQLTPLFFRTRRLYAPPGSHAAEALRPVLSRLGDQRYILPLAGDQEELSTPFSTTWSHAVPEVRLVLTYTFAEGRVEVISVRPAYLAV